MNRHPEMKGLRGCQGQAATEFTVAASFVLVPLFLLIPLLGKYIDIKQASVQQARFEAWEYTAWYNPDEAEDADLADSLKSKERAGLRDFTTTRSKGNQLFFSDITATGYQQRTAPGQTPPALELNPLWIDHRGDTLFQQRLPDSPVEDFKDIGTPDPTGGLFNKFIDLISLVPKTFGKILNLVGSNGDFNALNSKGYFTSTFQVDVRTSREVVPDLSNPAKLDPKKDKLTIKAKASVLARGWNAGSTANASSESQGLVPTSLLAKPSEWFNKVVIGLQRVVNVAKHVMPIDIKLPHGPVFGYMEDDLMPYEHLVGDTRKTKENNGLYYYPEK
ncbi:MAG TPA: hypothetical protein DDY32_03220 [Desulfobulbaceae bacterium]|nr:hypothetical protein [Desulfobulbaceae bacterium]